MPPEAALAPAAPRWPALSRAWSAALWRLGAAWVLLIAAFLPQWLAMAHQWWNISTYTHMLLVPAIIAWLVTLRAPELLKLAPAPGWPGLALFAAALGLWLAGSFAGLALAEQAGAVAMLAAAVPALLGIRVAAALRFPLFYMAFLVPFGDELVPQLQQLDAVMTVALLKLTGVPVHVEGVFLWTPAGLFEIAEACSGVKFLIAMVAFGALAAEVCFLSWRRRVPFLAACVVVPVVANGIRSWATVFVAQYVGAEKAGGFDHIVYGWIFFALVIAGTLAAAWRWFDRAAGDPMIDAARIAASPRLARLAAGPARGWVMPVLMALAAFTAIGWARAADGLRAPLPDHAELPAVPGWRFVAYRPGQWWEPRATGANARLLARYEDAAGHQVDVFAALYASQGPGRKADGWGEGAWRPDSGWAWQGPATAPADARGDRLLAEGPRERLAWTSWLSGSTLTGSPARLRLAGIGHRVTVTPAPTLTLILSAEAVPGRPEPAASLAAFRAAIGPLAPWMAGIAAGAPAAPTPAKPKDS